MTSINPVIARAADLICRYPDRNPRELLAERNIHLPRRLYECVMVAVAARKLFCAPTNRA